MVIETLSRSLVNNPSLVHHWYDFLCPFCYVGQSRTDALVRRGFHVRDVPFQAHPDIPPGGIAVGPRVGEMYERLEQEARDVGLTLVWPSHLPDTRTALAAAEWTRTHAPRASGPLNKSLFEAHFALGEDLGDRAVIDHHASRQGVDLVALHRALDDGSAMEAVDLAQAMGHDIGVHGTPTWLVEGRLISGLKPIAYFDALTRPIP